MQTLLDVISIDNKGYEELNESQRWKLNKFVDKLKEVGLEEKILIFVNRKYNVSELESSDPKFIFENNFPKDLSDEIDKVWVSI